MSVLVLGAGLVSGPVFEYLHQHSIPFSVVSSLDHELQRVRGKYPDVTCHCVDVSDPQLPPLLSQHDLIINLFPPPLLVQVSEMCIQQGRNMLCASYISPDLWPLQQRATEAGVLLLCECGLDPGLDHMLAMEVIDKVVAEGGKVETFTSWCGGIPAPECKNNPLQYKFSWNPKGALMASQRTAGYILQGEVQEVAADKVLDTVYPIDTTNILPGVQLEGHANKFYPHHLEAYGLKGIKTFFRGTLRYDGFCNAVESLIQAGLFSQTSLPCLAPDAPNITWKAVLKHLVTGDADCDENEFEEKLLVRLHKNKDKLQVLRGLGLLSETPVDKQGTPFDSLAALLMKTLSYEPGERDMIVMQHEIDVELPDKGRQTHHVGLVVYGQPGGHSAMAQTVGYPIGIVAELILKGKIKRKGIVLPTTEDIYRPVLSALADMGIAAKMSTSAS